MLLVKLLVKWTSVIKILWFLVPDLEMKNCCSDSLKSKISCNWTEQGRIRKFENLSLVWWSEFRITELRIIVFNIPKYMSSRAYAVAWTNVQQRKRHTGSRNDSRFEYIFLFHLNTQPKNIKRFYWHVCFVFVCVCSVALFDLYMTNRRQ